MSEKKKSGFSFFTEKAASHIASFDTADMKEKAQKAGEFIGGKAMDIKGSAMAAKEDITEKLTELDRMLEASITEYNDAYTLMNDKGVRLFIERNRSVDTISFIEQLINSIASQPKSFESDFDEIKSDRNVFLNSCDFGEHELQAARIAAGGAGAGIAAGASVAFMAPTAAMWVATTFGTASTGTAISALSGAAAQNAALAWLGGGALTAGGSGMAGGSAVLAMAGPVGWTIVGATLLTSIVLFSKNRAKLNKQKNEEIEAVKKNTERVKEVDALLNGLLTQTNMVRTGLNEAYMSCADLFGKNYMTFDEEQKLKLGALVNQTKTLAALLGQTIN